MPRKKAKKTTRRARGSGSIYEDARRKCWVGKAIVGRKANGRLKYREVRASSQAGVVALMQVAAPPAPGVSLEAWSARWLDSLDIRPQSVDSYREAVRLRIVPQLGARPVNAVTVFDIEEAVRTWRKAVGAGSVRKTLAVLSACLQGAVRAALIARNPARAVKRPPPAPPKLDIFTADELDRIIALALTKPNWRPFAVCAATGCRIGEATALKPGDYDPLTGKLTIARTKTRRHGHGKPKSKRSERTITVPPEARPALAAGVPNAHHPNAHVRWGKLLAALGLRYRNIHQMKHSVASLLVAAGTDLADAAAYLGDTFEVFIRTYVHAVGSDPAGVISGFLGGARAARLAAEAAKVTGKRGE